MLKKNKILDVAITNESEEKILEYILQRLKSPEKFYIVTPNPEIIVYANKHENYKNILNSAEISLPDGAGLFLASIIMAKPFRQRIPGIDFMEKICKRSVRNPISIGLLGGRADVAQRTAECLLLRYPGLDVVFVGEEWDNSLRLKDQSSKLQIDLLFVAYGAPKQEEWIYNNLKNLPVKAAMGVGGAFDYISGEVQRAPFAVRALGFEWLYRLIRQPWRWRRQLALLEFVRLVAKERFQRKN